MESWGYGGIFFLMALENIFPPLPSEIIIPVAGYAAASNGLNLLLVILVASIGALVGIWPWFLLGKIFGLERVKYFASRYGRIITFSPEEIDKAEKWFGVYGHKAVLFGRLIPTVRTLISIPAGIAKMKLSVFLVYSFIGSLLWTSALAVAGFLLESRHEVIASYLNPVSNAILLVIILSYLYRVITFKQEKN